MIRGTRPFVTSWFNFWLMPGASVLSPVAAESKVDLEEALATIEEVIEELMEEGIPSENIVLSGASQGGVLTQPFTPSRSWVASCPSSPGSPCSKWSRHPPWPPLST